MKTNGFHGFVVVVVVYSYLGIGNEGGWLTKLTRFKKTNLFLVSLFFSSSPRGSERERSKYIYMYFLI